LRWFASGGGFARADLADDLKKNAETVKRAKRNGRGALPANRPRRRDRRPQIIDDGR
jgi:hypothetical protein